MKNKCSKSLIIRERQLNATVGHHLTPIRMATIKTNKQKSESDGKDLENLGHLCTVGEYKIYSPAIKSSVVVPQKIKNKLAI